MKRLNRVLNLKRFAGFDKELIEWIGRVFESKKYMHPPVPEGYNHIKGEWNNGFVIERFEDGSHFVWVPVGVLIPNGTLDAHSFNQKFGRRNYMAGDFTESGFYERMSRELRLQCESVKKHGGFYISAYNISKNMKTGKPQSVEGEKPWTKISGEDAAKIARTFEKSKDIRSHLPFGAEYDSVLEWLVQSGDKSYAEVAKDSSNWGNIGYCGLTKPKVFNTGKSSTWKANNIYDLAGNVMEWTQETDPDGNYTLRGQVCCNKWERACAAQRYSSNHQKKHNVGFRIALFLK